MRELLNRRNFISRVFLYLGAGAFSLSSGVGKSNGQEGPAKRTNEMKYQVKRSYVLVENGGQTDWAKHDPDLITYCRSGPTRDMKKESIRKTPWAAAGPITGSWMPMDPIEKD
jgi:hypothetical protein